MNAKFFLGTLLAALLVFNGCVSTKSYETWTYEKDSNYTVLHMKAVDPNSEYFTIRFDHTIWELEEWKNEPIEDSVSAEGGESTESRFDQVAPNQLALVHKMFKDDYSPCVLLPGSIGQSQFDDSYLFYEGNMITSRYNADTVNIINPAGVQILQLTGFEVDGIRYIFELEVAAKDSTTCLSDAQSVIGSFKLDSYVPPVDGEAEAPSEATESTPEVEADSSEN